jgi:hypothetical protein
VARISPYIKLKNHHPVGAFEGYHLYVQIVVIRHFQTEKAKMNNIWVLTMGMFSLTDLKSKITQLLAETRRSNGIIFMVPERLTMTGYIPYVN